ncbi:MAG: hypothetical protein HKP40_01945 [Litoreibacter sp.]|nr:hypothetical protein [Litoreibacter sp.]
MPDIQKSDPGDKDTFVIHLSRAPGGDLRVTSTELILSDLRNRYSFKPARAVDDVFAAPLAGEIRSVLGRIDDSSRVMSYPELDISMPGLILSGLRVLLTRLDDGAEVIMMRFRHYVGAIKSCFKFDPSMTLDSATMREKIAVEVLRDIVTPLFDIAAFSKAAGPAGINSNHDAIARRLGEIDLRQDEINFYIGLLQRYVAGCRSDAIEQQAVHTPDPLTSRP